MAEQHLNMDGAVRVEKTVTIDRPVQDLYRFWRKLDNLPGIMPHLKTVAVVDDKRSRWVTKGPMGTSFEWVAEIVYEKENERIDWKSVGGSEITAAGSVYFKKAPGDRGTEVKIVLSYLPPGGSLGAMAAKLTWEEPSRQIMEDLRKFKQLMETGEIATIEGQSAGA